MSITELAEGVGGAIAVARLVHLGLARRQPALLAFLWANTVGLLALGSFPQSSTAYFWIYVVFSFVNPIVAVYAVREMFGLTFDAYPGIRSAGRWTMYAATALTATVALGISIVFWGGGRRGESYIFYVYVVDRSVVMTLAGVMIAILLFLSRYPLHLRHNTYVATSFFSAILLSEAVVMLLDSLSTHLYFVPADIAQPAFGAICFAGWALMLRPSGAERPEPIRGGDPDERELLLQLESLNTLLTRAARR